MWRLLPFCMLLVAACILLTAGLAPGQGIPIPPGLRSGDKPLNTPMEEPAQPNRKKIDPKILTEEAGELARLSADIPAQIGQVNKGQLPKDLDEKLKKIEKLAKRLRSDVSP